MAGTAINVGNFNGCRKLSISFQFIFILQPKMTRLIQFYKTYKTIANFCNTMCLCEGSCGQRNLKYILGKFIFIEFLVNLE